jgi:hypothetical protein
MKEETGKGRQERGLESGDRNGDRKGETGKDRGKRWGSEEPRRGGGGSRLAAAPGSAAPDPDRPARSREARV